MNNKEIRMLLKNNFREKSSDLGIAKKSGTLRTDKNTFWQDLLLIILCKVPQIHRRLSVKC